MVAIGDRAEIVMELSGLNPFIRYACLHATYAVSAQRSVCYDCRLFYVLGGTGTLLVGESSYSISRGTAIYMPPATRYRFSFATPDEVRIYVINFDLTDEHSDTAESLGTAKESGFDPSRVMASPSFEVLSAPIILTGTSAIEGLAASCVELFLGKTANYQYRASAYLKLALIEMLNARRLERGEYRLVDKIEEIVRESYADPELSNLKVASELAYHPYYLSRLMSRYTGMTLHEYITSYRLRMAMNYLTTTALSVGSVAELTGFSSYTYFIKCFRERVGISPLKYRKRNALSPI